MTPEAAQLFGLLALRALALSDPIEFRRVTDASLRELNEQIDGLLKRVDDPVSRQIHQQLLEGEGPTERRHHAEVVKVASCYATMHAMRLSDRARPPLTNPQAVIERGMSTNDLQWVDPDHGEYRSLWYDEALVRDGRVADLLEVVTSIAGLIADPQFVEGTDACRKAAIWSIGTELLSTAGLAVRARATAKGLSDAARRGETRDWLERHVVGLTPQLLEERIPLSDDATPRPPKDRARRRQTKRRAP